MAKVNEKQVQEMRAKCGLSEGDCRAALDKYGVGVDETLVIMIAAGELAMEQLDPKKVSTDLFARAQAAESAWAFRKMMEEHLQQGEKGVEAMLEEMIGSPEMMAQFGEMAQRQAERAQKLLKRRTQGAGKLDLPPLPPLRFKEYFWEGEDVFASWAGFGAWGPRARKPSNGKAMVGIAPPGEVDDQAKAPAAEQISAYEYLKTNEKAVAEAVLRKIFQEYPKLRKTLGNLMGDKVRPVMKEISGQFPELAKHIGNFGDDEPMPAINKVEDLKKLISLGRVYVLSVEKGGMAYLGFEFECAWDPEHGLGVMVHGNRVVGFGMADVAFDEGMAMEDGGKML